MAVKRPAEGVELSKSPKQRRLSRQSPTDLQAQDEALSIDRISNFTDNGTERAKSEARRAWHYVCTFEGCGQRFNRPCRLENHMRSHNRERPYECSSLGCGKTFPRKDHLQRHVKTAHAEVQRNFVCEWKGCDKAFTSRGRLQRHEDVHKSKFYCTDYPPCNEVFRKSKTLDAHIASVHLAAKPFQCPHEIASTRERCSSGYETELGLQRHIQRAHNAVEDCRHYCMTCPTDTTTDCAIDVNIDAESRTRSKYMSFARLEDLEAHQREVHPPNCDDCGMNFKDQATLKTHINTVHGDPANQPRFECSWSDCHAVFNRKHNLTVHVHAVHEKQIKFVCAATFVGQTKRPDVQAWTGENACGVGFKAKSSLEQHIRTHHLGLKNRKMTRRIARAKPVGASALSLLTGVGYGEDRKVPCLVGGCKHRFVMDRDLRRHLQTEHCLSEADVEASLLERDASNGGQFWVGGFDEHDSMDIFDSVDPSLPQTPMLRSSDAALPSSVYGASFEATNGTSLSNKFDSLVMLDADDADLDAAMGLGSLAPASDALDGLGWDGFELVERQVW